MDFLKNFKIFNDSIHGHIELHPLCVKIIDTPQFQRLRCIQQLGTLYRVYPGATHNRFEHSIGVCYLAGEFVKELRCKQPLLDISDEDQLCIEIAGLCHDLGHGPFSHVFDLKFLPRIHKDDRKDKSIKHEDISILMFDHMLESNNLIAKFETYNLDKKDIEFIKELIIGNENYLNENWPYNGRKRDKNFLYEIVANKHNGVDVDKCDYFVRDCHHLGIKSMFDHRRLIKQARVINFTDDTKNPISHICFRNIEACNLYDLFYSRQALYRRAYCHKTCTIIDEMIVEGLVLANDFIEIEGKDRRKLKISEAHFDMHAYEKLTNNIYYTILHSSDEKLEPARVIFRRIESRDLFKFLGEITVSKYSSEMLEKAKKKKVPTATLR